MTEIRQELAAYLQDKRDSALRQGRLKEAYRLTCWIKHVLYHAQNVEISQYYLQYWNTTHNQNRLRKLAPIGV